MPRIAVVGNSGSGKTTVAFRAAEALGVPHIELDALHWEPNWMEAPNEILRERVRNAVQGDSWVADGNYSKVRDILWARVDTVVWLDYPFHVSYMRLLRRTLGRIYRRERLWNDNRETLRMAFSGDSILLWAIRSYPKNKREFPKLMRDPAYAHINFICHKAPQETEEWLGSLKD